MADYYAQTVVEQVIPNADMTPLERLVLTHVFDSEEDGNGLYLFAETGPSDFVYLPVPTLKTAMTESAGIASSLTAPVAKLLNKLRDADTDVEIDLTVTSYEPILQDIVRRSPTLDYITVVAAFTCSKMRPDGFGGMATFITAGAVKGMSTHRFIEDCLADFERKKRTPPAQA
jgi:hypothetical protein